MTHPERPYCQKWYYLGETLLLKVVMTGFARFLRLEVDLLSFWLYGHAIKPDDTVSNVCCIYRPFAMVFARLGNDPTRIDPGSILGLD
jgi:hypothetical protein